MRKFKTFYNLYSLQKRIVAILVGIIVLFSAIVGRVFYLQIIKGKNLQVLASSQWMRTLPLSSKRGEILDCNGVSVATTTTTYDVYVRARNVTNPTELATALSESLNLEFDKTLSKVKNTGLSEVLIKMQVEETTAKNLTKYDGVYLSQNVKRYYPYSSLATQILGYCTIDNIGQAGLELYYDKYLKGIDGKSLTQTNAQGKEIENSLGYYIPSVAGANLKTTIDVQIQSILESALQVAYQEHKAKGTSGIVLDAQTGGILAMSCVPNFDLNNVPRDNIELLQYQTKNSTVVDVYEPGSTFKLITLSAALNEGLTNVNEHFYCGGRCSVDGEIIKCWKTAGHGSETLVEAFKNSCNCVFVQLALRIGVEKYYEYLKMFGLGEKTGVDIASESSGILMDKDRVKNVDLARIGFGHAVAVTQLQMANVYSMITTGNKITPHLLDSVSVDGKVLFQTNNTNKSVNLKQSTIETINQMLFNNINSEEKYTFVSGYDVGGKTGTAQKYDENGKIATGKYISSFIGTYPSVNPKYVVIVCVDEPSNGAYYGGVVAKPIGQQIFSNLFNIKSIAPNDVSQVQNQPTVEMPYLVGKTIGEACSILKKLGLGVVFDTDGEYVAEQFPPEGTKIYVGEIVYLIVN
ncbi:MAG: penicillin-binding transpeptidase domain-containing protein [Candidatus Onthoplasma sp.]